MSFLVSPQSEAMRTSEFDSSSEDEEVGEEQLTPFHVSWLVSAVFNLCDVRNVWLNVKHLCVLCLFCLLIGFQVTSVHSGVLTVSWDMCTTR